MDPYRHSGSVVVGASPDTLYAMVSDVTRTGQWSPICTACWWDDGATGRVGDWFTGRNEVPDRSWETRSQVVAADPGREFAWVVGGDLVRWGYLIEPDADGTRLAETWAFLPAGLALFRDKYGEGAQTRIADRTHDAHASIPVTLAAIKHAAEAGRS